MTTGSVFSATLTNNDPGFTGATRRQVFPVSAITAPGGAPTQVRVKLNAASNEGYDLGAAYIGHKASSGDAYDFAATPVQLTFDGNPSVSIPAGGSVWSDWVNFAWDKATDILISEECGGTSAADSCRALNGTAIGNYYKFFALDAATVDATGYSTSGIGTLDLISDIEMDGFAASSGQWPDEPTDHGNRYTKNTVCDDLVPLTRDEMEVEQFRTAIYTEDAAVATLDFRCDCRHEMPGNYMGVVEVAAYFIMRSGDTYDDAKIAAPVQIKRTRGGNIVNHTHHYIAINDMAKVALEAGKYYIFSVMMKSDAGSGNPTEGMAAVLAEGSPSEGLNNLHVTVDKGEILIS